MILMTSSAEQLVETLEAIRLERFPHIPRELLEAALAIERDHPDSSEREMAQRKLEALVEKYLAK
jgi:hypothetical protein